MSFVSFNVGRYSDKMSDIFDSDDFFVDITADELDALEWSAIQATQPSVLQQLPYQRHQSDPRPQAASFQYVAVAEENTSMEDDYVQFNADDEFVIDDEHESTDVPFLPSQPQHTVSSHESALIEELAALRAEKTRLKLERDKYETLAFSQDGKLDHLNRTLAKGRAEYEAALDRLKRAAETERRTLQADLADRDRKLAGLSADIEFQRNELRQAREQARDGGVSRSTTTNSEPMTPKKAKVVKGSGVKSPEARSRIGVMSARAFGKEESVVSTTQKKRKHEEARVTPDRIFPVEEVSEVEINRIVIERIICDRASWTISDERFEVALSRSN